MREKIHRLGVEHARIFRAEVQTYGHSKQSLMDSLESFESFVSNHCNAINAPKRPVRPFSARCEYQSCVLHAVQTPAISMC